MRSKVAFVVANLDTKKQRTVPTATWKQKHDVYLWCTLAAENTGKEFERHEKTSTLRSQRLLAPLCHSDPMPLRSACVLTRAQTSSGCILQCGTQSVSTPKYSYTVVSVHESLLMR